MYKIKLVIKRIFIFIVLIILFIAFSSSYASFNMDNLGYVVALGIDVGTNSRLKVSFQFTTPSSVTESGSTEETPSIINTVEANSIDAAINLMNSYIGKNINLSHCKIFVFSEKIAMQGLSSDLYALVTNTQVRSSANIAISKCDASYYIENSKPILETLLTKYYEIFPTSSNYTGITSNISIGEFFGKLSSSALEPTAILSGIITDTPSSISDLDRKSGSSSISGKRGAENIGLAVFKEDKLVGELNAQETICYSLTTNDVDGFLITIPDPEDETRGLDVYIYTDSPTKSKVEIVNHSPYITVNCNLKARIYSLDKNKNYNDEETLNKISQNTNDYIESMMLNYLYRTAKDFKSDINGFGKQALSQFLTTKDFIDYHWLENYENAFFKVNIQTNVKSGFLFSET